MVADSAFPRPVHFLRAEALGGLLASGVAYHLLFPHRWLVFACLFLVPDLSLLLFVRGPNIAASVVYNLMHTYIFPAILGALAFHFGSTLLGEASLIWIFHISLDRVLGYGLKYANSFKFTHLQNAAHAPNLMPSSR